MTMLMIDTHVPLNAINDSYLQALKRKESIALYVTGG